MPKKICVFTDHPSITRGRKAMVDFMSSALRQNGHRIVIYFPSRSFWDLVLLKRRRWAKDGIEYVSLPAIPRISVLNYLLPSLFIKKDLEGYDMFLAIGGSNHAAIPFFFNKKPYTLWVATSYMDEWQAQFDPLEVSVSNIYYHFINILGPYIVHLEKKIYENAERILCISRYTKKAISARFGINSIKINILPYAVDTTIFRPLAQARPGAEKYLLSVGKVSDPRKNLSYLLEVFACLAKKVPEMRLIVVGRPRRRHTVTAKRLGISDRVIFLGNQSRERLVRLYQDAQAFVLSSNQEGLGIVLLEAMACGLCVVSTRCGGPEDIINNGENGFFAPKNDLEQFAGVVLKILEDSGLRKKVSDDAVKFIEINYSTGAWKHKIPEFLGL